MTLLSTMVRIETIYGDVCNDSLGRLYEDGLNALRIGDDRAQLLASEALIEWEKEYLWEVDRLIAG